MTTANQDKQFEMEASAYSITHVKVVSENVHSVKDPPFSTRFLHWAHSLDIHSGAKHMLTSFSLPPEALKCSGQVRDYWSSGAQVHRVHTEHACEWLNCLCDLVIRVHVFFKKKQNKTYPYHLTGPVDFNFCKYFFYMELAVMLVLVIYTETMKSAERFHIILDHILL